MSSYNWNVSNIATLVSHGQRCGIDSKNRDDSIFYLLVSEMDGFGLYVLVFSNTVILRRWKVENGGIGCAMKRRLGSERISPRFSLEWWTLGWDFPVHTEHK